MAPSVLIIGASGSLGRPLVAEFQKQKSRFARVAILADPAKAHKFAEEQKNGIDIVLGSFLDFKSYQGAPRLTNTAVTPLTPHRLRRRAFARRERDDAPPASDDRRRDRWWRAPFLPVRVRDGRVPGRRVAVPLLPR
jgi:hypothetical protein